ncbi:MAG: 3-phosphoserine/phosphohydroxythreonine transaminase [Firmicutes bacterium]|nr:3-phosphoserine/phosphohydroxythreonine transaminase [Bacillota bacterium]
MTHRVYNFNPGPATLPQTVLEEAQDTLINYQKTGMSVMELSHRAKEISFMMEETESLCAELLNIPEDYSILFLQGGASLQFAMVALNFLLEGYNAGYILTGSFAEKSYQEAQKVGSAYIAASTKKGGYKTIPQDKDIVIKDKTIYLHLTSNNTIFGSQWQSFPELKNVHLVADMSSDIMSRPLNISQFGLIYAGAQKNLGPAGVTLIIVSPAMLSYCRQDLPVILQYTTHAKNKSLYNTPPTFNIYIMNLVLKWLKQQGGLKTIDKINRTKANLIYQVIDKYSSFYIGHANKEYRSLMNITFRLPSAELEKKFLQQASSEGLVGLKGHRSVGGIRASIYNAMPVDGCKALADFMESFYAANTS